MKILQINTFNSRGGAAKVCTRLKNKLDHLGIENWMYIKESVDSTSDDIYTSKNSFLHKVLNKIFKTEGFGRNTFNELKNLPCWDEIDIVQIHNIHGSYFNIGDIKKISESKKVVWTLHDPWILWNKKSIPQYKMIFKFRNYYIEMLKKKIVLNSNFLLITPSVWLKNLVLNDYPNKEVLVVPNWVDTDIFSPINKLDARINLNLPTDKKIILFVANGGLNNHQKGTDYIKFCIERFNECLFIEIGRDIYIESESDMAMYYSAADLLLLPSLAENFPLSILESMSCGTPVVAFDTGGINEIIDHRINGYVAKYKNSEDLIKGIQFITNESNYTKLSKSSREKIMTNFSENLIFEKYINIYKRLLN